MLERFDLKSRQHDFTTVQAGKTHAAMANIREKVRMLKIGGDVCPAENTPPETLMKWCGA
jgi:hypothetical protein